MPTKKKPEDDCEETTPKLPHARAYWDTVFNSNIEKRGPDDCWIWRGMTNKETGYGYAMFRSKRTTAHRYAYMLAHGIKEHIDRKLFVCHKCDNPPCCNPNHLYLGDQFDNMRDMLERGRDNYDRGERHTFHKLTEAQVAEIRAMYAEGNMPQTAIGAIFGVHQVTISKVTRGFSWQKKT